MRVGAGPPKTRGPSSARTVAGAAFSVGIRKSPSVVRVIMPPGWYFPASHRIRGICGRAPLPETSKCTKTGVWLSRPIELDDITAPVDRPIAYLRKELHYVNQRNAK